MKHVMTAKKVPGRCGTRGPTDIEIKCSCGGFKSTLHEATFGNYERLNAEIKNHKIAVLAEALGITFEVRFETK